MALGSRARQEQAPGRAERPWQQAGDAQGRLVEVGADEEQRVLIKHLSTQGALGNDREDVLQEGAVAAAHVHDTLGLLVQWAVEQVNDYLVYFF